MATNNCLNLKSSGIVSYDGAGVFTALANPLTVSNGGFGVSSNTAYAVLTGGTTSTNPVQSIASVGSAGQTLESNGASALPTFQAPGGYVVISQGLTGNPSDSTTYYLAIGFSSAGTTSGNGFASTRFTVPFSGTIKAAYGAFTCTAGSSANSTVRIVINNSKNVDISTTVNLNAAEVAFSNAGLNTAVSAGDYFNVRWITPAWTPTNPTNCRVALSIYIE